MGGGQSTVQQVQYPGNDEVALLASQTSFSVNGVQALYELYESMCSSEVGLVSSEADKGLMMSNEQFMTALFSYSNKYDLFAKWETEFVLAKNEKKEHFIAERIFGHFDVDAKGVIGFGDFVRALNVLHPDGPKEAKIDVAFKLYDLDNTGFIERHAVQKMVITVLRESKVDFTDETIEAILDKTFADADTNKDGKIDKAEWQLLVSKHPQVVNCVTIPELCNITTLFPDFIFKSKFDELDL